MAIAIDSFAADSNWFASGAKTVTGRSWDTDDVIIVFAALENGSGGQDLSAPTNGNLTFTQRSFIGNTNGQECEAGLWTAVAGSTQSSQTITLPSASWHQGLAVWVVSGVDNTTITGLTATNTESRYSQSVTAGDLVVVGLGDWNATNPPGKTPNATLSSTATERFDTGNGSTYAVYGADWIVGTTGTGSFGPNNYTSLKVAQVGVYMSPTAAAAAGTPPLRRRFMSAQLQM